MFSKGFLFSCKGANITVEHHLNLKEKETDYSGN